MLEFNPKNVDARQGFAPEFVWVTQANQIYRSSLSHQRIDRPARPGIKRVGGKGDHSHALSCEALSGSARRSLRLRSWLHRWGHERSGHYCEKRNQRPEVFLVIRQQQKS
jgi:hypothetical protein